VDRFAARFTLAAWDEASEDDRRECARFHLAGFRWDVGVLERDMELIAPLARAGQVKVAELTICRPIYWGAAALLEWRDRYSEFARHWDGLAARYHALLETYVALAA
jgi:hypothetical protein